MALLGQAVRCGCRAMRGVEIGLPWTRLEWRRMIIVMDMATGSHRP